MAFAEVVSTEGDRLLTGAVALHVLGRLREAEEAARRALAVYEQPPAAAARQAVACDELATILDAAARHREAEPFHRRAGELLVMQPTGAGFDRTRLRCARGLAANLRAQGRLLEAHDILVPALAYAQQLLGAHDTDTSVTLADLATTCDGLGRAGEAEVFYRDALTAFEAVWPTNVRRVAVVAARLSRLLAAAGRRQEAQAMADRAVTAAATMGLGIDGGTSAQDAALRLAELATASGALVDPPSTASLPTTR
jgi:tetratricopeptide (TPR) repeat protein